MIKAVFFDLGKILVDFDWEVSAKKIAARSGRPFKEILYTCTGSDLALNYEKGVIPTEKFLPALKNALQYREDLASLSELWSDIFTPVADHVILVKQLAANYKIGLISNTNHLHFTRIEKSFDFIRLFDSLALSFQEGCLKPDRAIFEKAIRPFGLSGSEAVFIDDISGNLKGAAELGWKTIHWTPQKNLALELEKAGVKI